MPRWEKKKTVTEERKDGEAQQERGSKSLDQMMAYFDKEFGLREKVGDEKDLIWIPSGSMIIDKVCGGGYPLGRIVEIYGMESTGKSTLGVEACVEAAKKGWKSLYLDFEQALDYAYAENIGLDYKFTTFRQPENVEQGNKIVTGIMATGEIKLVVIDSVAAMLPKDILEGEVGDDQKVGLHARLVSQMVAKIKTLTNRHQVCAILTNQIRSAIPKNKFDHVTEYRPGGKALGFYESIRLRLRNIEKEFKSEWNPLTFRVEKKPICNIVEVYGEKNKVARPYLSGEFAVSFGEGIDNIRTIIELAVNAKVAERSSNGFITIKGLSKPVPPQRGAHEMKEYLRQNKDVLQDLVDHLPWDAKEPPKGKNEATDTDLLVAGMEE